MHTAVSAYLGFAVLLLSCCCYCCCGASQSMFRQVGPDRWPVNHASPYLPIWWGMGAKASSGGISSSCCSVRRGRAASSRGASTSQCLPRATRPAAHAGNEQHGCQQGGHASLETASFLGRHSGVGQTGCACLGNRTRCSHRLSHSAVQQRHASHLQGDGWTVDQSLVIGQQQMEQLQAAKRMHPCLQTHPTSGSHSILNRPARRLPLRRCLAFQSATVHHDLHLPAVQRGAACGQQSQHGSMLC